MAQRTAVPAVGLAGTLMILAAWLGPGTAPANAADERCIDAERHLNYWVFGDTAAFNTWQGQCAQGRAALDALIGAQGRDPGAQALIRQCPAELGAALVARKFDDACRSLARTGIPKPAAPAPSAAYAGLPECLQTLEGTFREVVSQRVFFANVDTEVVTVWTQKDGKLFYTWTVPSNGMSGTSQMIGTEGSEVVFVSTTNGYNYQSRGKVSFDATCSSYAGTYVTAGGAVQVRGQRAP